LMPFERSRVSYGFLTDVTPISRLRVKVRSQVI